MKNKSFTTIEIMISVLVLAILSAAGIVVWNNAVENARLDICKQNEVILQESLKFYIADNDAVPTSLSLLMPKYTGFALAHLKRTKTYRFSILRKIYLAMIGLQNPKEAYAAFSDYLGMNQGVLRCPSKTGAGLSYGYNHKLQEGGMTAMEIFDELAANNLPIICDCNNATFTSIGSGDIQGAAYRHGHRIFGIGEKRAVAVSGENIRVITETENWSETYNVTPIGVLPEEKPGEGAPEKVITQTLDTIEDRIEQLEESIEQAGVEGVINQIEELKKKMEQLQERIATVRSEIRAEMLEDWTELYEKLELLKEKIEKSRSRF